MNMHLRKFVSIVLMVFLCLSFTLNVFADNNAFYVNDQSGVLSDDDIGKINRTSQVIFEQTGCKISVAVVDFLGGKTIEQYSKDLYEFNHMGSNGLLMVFSIAEENYYVIQGSDLEQQLSNQQIKDILDRLVEQSFEAEAYQTAIMDLYNAAVKHVGEIYSAITDPELYKEWLEEQRIIEEQRIAERGRWFAVFVVSVTAAAVFAAIMIVWVIMNNKRRRRYAK